MRRWRSKFFRRAISRCHTKPPREITLDLHETDESRCVAIREAVEFATLEWVDWFNNRRLLEPIGNIPPAEAEERYYAMLAETAVAA
jgi:transposase InsO family protein